jgi:Dihaem cytochrome c
LPRSVLTLLLALAAGCGGAVLPEPDAPGARVLRERCGGCHRVYAPGTMTVEMWKVQVARMQALFAQKGIPPLAPDEERVLMDYLGAHAGTS